MQTLLGWNGANDHIYKPHSLRKGGFILHRTLAIKISNFNHKNEKLKEKNQKNKMRETVRRVAPPWEREWSFWALIGWENAECLTRANVGWQNFRLASAKWYPKLPVTPIINILLFSMLTSSFAPCNNLNYLYLSIQDFRVLPSSFLFVLINWSITENINENTCYVIIIKLL